MLNPDSYPILTDLDDTTYHGMTDHVSSSMIKAMEKSPAHCRWMLDNPTPDTDALRVGRACHKLALEGREAFDAVFRVKYLNWSTTDGKKEKEAFLRAGVTPVSTDEFALAQGVAHAITSHPITAGMTADGDPVFEKAILWTDSATGLKCRAKPDVLCANGVIDIKTARSAHPLAFGRSAQMLGYWLQAAHYLAGVEALCGTGEWMRFIFLTVETVPPYACRVFEYSREATQFALLKREKLMIQYAECLASGKWPGYPTGIDYLSDYHLRANVEDAIDE